MVGAARRRSVASVTLPFQPTPEDLRRALTRPASPPVRLRESYASWVVLAEDRAYRLFKRVRLAAVDLRSYEGRLGACEDVVRAERDLGGGVVLGVRSVVPVGDSFAIAGESHPDAVDQVVEMRRFDPAETLLAHARDHWDPSLAAAVGERLAVVHARVPAVEPLDPIQRARGDWHFLVEAVKAMRPPPLPPRRLSAIARFSDAFTRARGPQLRKRAEHGRVRDGHGDLRPEHVLCGRPEMPLVGREAHDVGLRRVDVGDDLATLLAHLEHEGAQRWADAILAAYRESGGDPGDDQLLAFWAARRALVAAARSSPPTGAATERSRDFADLAERLVWRARGPAALVVCGRPRDGRSRLAAALARRSGWSLTRDVRCATARTLTARGGTDVVVEHPLDDRASQDAVIGALRRSGRQPRVVECRGPESLRTAIRPDVPTRHRLVVDPEGDAEDLLDQIAVWLDASLRDLTPSR